MDSNVTLKAMLCPCCGAKLKAENSNSPIVCVYCGNTILPVSAPSNGNGINTDGAVRISGINSPASLLAYVDVYFEEYDWDSFVWGDELTISYLDETVESFKTSSADDKNTWLLAFKTTSIPYLKKLDRTRIILDTVIEEYKKGNKLLAYNKFDAYKRIVDGLIGKNGATVSYLKRVLELATKFGASASEISAMKMEIASIENQKVRSFAVLEDIDEVSTFIEETNKSIKEKLQSKGIDADSEYERAKELIDKKDYVNALTTLLTLEGYLDSDELIEIANRSFLLSEVIEISGEIYVAESNSEANSVSLYPIKNKKIAEAPIISDISKIISNYASIIYYLNYNHRLIQYDCSKHTKQTLSSNTYDKDFIYLYDYRRSFLLANTQDSEKNLVSLDLKTGETNVIFSKVAKVVSTYGSKIVLHASDKEGSPINTYVIDVDTLEKVRVGAKGIEVVGFLDNNVIYTVNFPNQYNKKLCRKELTEDAPEVAIDRNIFEFEAIMAGYVFYYVGNARNKSLIKASVTGGTRAEMPLLVSELLFEEGGWLYFIRRAGYNSILCKSTVDGNDFKVIASDIQRYIDIKNGYLYYLDDYDNLIRIRMDGSGYQRLCAAVEDVLSIKEHKIVFVSTDGKTKHKSEEGEIIKNVKSIYAIDFTGSGIIKLCYDITSAQLHDDNTIYYKAERRTANGSLLNILCRLDVETNSIEKLVDLEHREPEKSHGFGIAIGIMVLMLFIALIGLISDTPLLTTLGVIGAVISLIVGLLIKPKSDNDE